MSVYSIYYVKSLNFKLGFSLCKVTKTVSESTTLCCCSVTKSCPALCNPRDYSKPDSLSFTISQSLCKFTTIESVILSSHLIFCGSLLFLPSISPSIGVFFNQLAVRIRWPKYWSFSISLPNEYSGLISVRIDWFGLLAAV